MTKEKNIYPSIRAACIMAEIKKDRIENSRVKKLETRIGELHAQLDEKQGRLDRMGKENNKLYNDIAQLKQKS